MKTTLLIITILILLFGFLPIIQQDFWAFRVWDYPRFQKFILVVLLIFIWLYISWGNFEWLNGTMISLLVILLGFLAYQIIPFTVMGHKMINDAANPAQGPSLSVMVINVFQDNKDFEKTIDLIKRESPDLFVLVETDQPWADAIKPFQETYPYFIEIPMDNTYGMLFYSKKEILEHEIMYLIEDDVPSINALVKVSDEETVKIFAIHPKPPVPSENDNSTERDAEILLVGKIVKDYKKPAMVLGDLNDVGWSFTNELFLRTSGLLDPRRGRGMFSTFHAKYFLLRWPLDHIFVSEHFTLERLVTYGNVNSDHFPIGAIFRIQPINGNDALESDQDDEEKATEKIEDGKEEGRKKD